MYFNICVIINFLYFHHIIALVEIPKTEENTILTTESVIRNTVNTLFVDLHLKNGRNGLKLKEYATVHKHFVSYTLEDFNNLNEIVKLTRADKRENNETVNFIAALNELFNDDDELGKRDFKATSNAGDVVTYINDFLNILSELKSKYGMNDGSLRISTEVYEILRDHNIISLNDSKDDDFMENETVLENNDFLKLSGRRIFQGKPVKIKYFPFVASVQIFNRFHCAGSIIASDLVISAASCLQLAYNNRFFRENPAFLSVKVGSTYSNSGETIGVLEVYFHPEYNPKNLWNNICIMRLVRKINLKKRRVKKIDFDRTPATLPLTTDGITIIGWGARQSNNIVKDPFLNSLSYAVLDMYPLMECQEVYSKEYVTRKNFCAGFFSKGGGACNKDVGGPGVVHGILVGVVSFGSPVCGAPDAPTVFTKLGYYTDWIEDIMEQEVPSALRKTTLKPVRVFTIPTHYDPPEAATFRIPPLTGTINPLPIRELELLRTFHNSDVFKQFISTMFGSKENLEIKNILEKNDALKSSTIKEVEITPDLNDKEEDDYQQTNRYADLRTTMGSVDQADDVVTEAYPEESETEESPFPTTQIPPDASLEKELVNLIDMIDLKHIIYNFSSSESNSIKLTKNLKTLSPKDQNIDKLTKSEESVLTLLYLSDSEKNQVQANDYDDEDVPDVDSEGMAIAPEPFKDLTYRNRNITVLNDILKNKEIYELLTEAIKDN